MTGLYWIDNEMYTIYLILFYKIYRWCFIIWGN